MSLETALALLLPVALFITLPAVTLTIKAWWLAAWLPLQVLGFSFTFAALGGADGPGGFVAYVGLSAAVGANAIVGLARLTLVAVSLRVRHHYVEPRQTP